MCPKYDALSVDFVPSAEKSRMVFMIHLFVLWQTGYTQESFLAPKSKSINTLSVLLLQSPTFSFMKCHREKPLSIISSLCYIHMMASE